MRHVGEEFRLVAAGPLQLHALLGERRLAALEVLFLARQDLGLLFELAVALLELGLLDLQPRLRFAQRLGLLLELLVGDAQLLLLGLELLRLPLRFLEQLLEPAAILRRADGEADRLADAGRELERDRVDAREEPELDHRVHDAVDARGGDEELRRATPARGPRSPAGSRRARS